MKYTLITYDGEMLEFDSAFLGTAQSAMTNKKPLKIKGQIVNGGDIRRIEPSKNQRSGGNSPMQATAYEVFALPTGEKMIGFWQTVLELNMARRKQQKIWIFEKAIAYVRESTSFTLPSDIFEFVDSEWETVKSKNSASQRVDYEARRAIIEWLKNTTDGVEYAKKWHLVG